MSDTAETAMTAIETALEPTRAERDATEQAIREEVATILAHLLGDAKDPGEAIKAVSALAGRFCLSVSDDPDEDWDDGEGWLSCDPHNLDEARARAERGQFDDCLHHLERALPEGYGVIAERLAHHFRSRP